MRAKARESRGQGNADAQVQMALTSDNGKTRGTIDTDVKLSGKAAAMGGGVIKEVSGKLVDQFSKNLAEMLGQGSAGTQPTPEAAAVAGPATPTASVPTSSQAEATPAQPTPTAAASAGPGTPTATQPQAESDALDVGSLVGPMVVARLKDPKVLGAVGILLALLVLFGRSRR